MESVGGRHTSLAEREEFHRKLLPTTVSRTRTLICLSDALKTQRSGLEGEETSVLLPAALWRRWPPSLMPLLTSCPGAGMVMGWQAH